MVIFSFIQSLDQDFGSVPTLWLGRNRKPMGFGLECRAVRGDGQWVGQEQGQGALSDGQWHHLLISYPGDSNLSATGIFLDGERVDLASRLTVLPRTSIIIPLKVGASVRANKMTGWLDEVRVSQSQDYAWAKYSYQNQKPGTSLLSLRSLPDRSGLACGYQCYGGSGYQYELSSSSDPPATSYSISSSNLPGG